MKKPLLGKTERTDKIRLSTYINEANKEITKMLQQPFKKWDDQGNYIIYYNEDINSVLIFNLDRLNQSQSLEYPEIPR